MDNNYHSALQAKAQLESELSNLEAQIASAQTAHQQQQHELAEKQKGVTLSYQEVEKLQQLRVQRVNELKQADQALSGEQKKLYNQLQQEFSALQGKANLLNQRIKEIHKLYTEIQDGAKALSAKGYQQVCQKRVLSLPSEFESSFVSDFKFGTMQNLLASDPRVKDSIHLVPITKLDGFLNG